MNSYDFDWTISDRLDRADRMDLMAEMEMSSYGRIDPGQPTNAIPGSLEKVIVMMRRQEIGMVKSGCGVFVAGDTRTYEIESDGTEIRVEAPIRHYPYTGDE